MKKTTIGKAGVAGRVPAFGIHPVAAACAAVFAAGTVMAQEAPAPAGAPAAAPMQLESIEVTGYRASIENSIAKKRNSDSIVETVTAEDIGKLPDSSIADTIARLPGLTAQRVAGRAQQISIRGFAPEFAVTLLNGREQVSTNENRGVEYDQYPSELINGLTVYKTPDATLADMGLSGTVNLETIKPLDQKERTIAVSARGERNSLGAINPESKGNGNRFSASYVDQFDDRKIGVAIGFAHLDEPGQEQHFGAWGYSVNPGGVPALPIPTGAVYTYGEEVAGMSRNQKRDGLLGSIEFRPNDQVKSSVDVYYSKFTKDETLRYALWTSDPTWDGSTITNPGLSNAGGTPYLSSGTLSTVNPIFQSNYNTSEDHIAAIGWNTTVKADGWKLLSDLSYSRATRHDHTLELYSGLSDGTALVPTNFTFNLPFGNTMPTFVPSSSFSDPNAVRLTDVGGWGQDAYERDSHITDKMSALKLSAQHALGGLFDSYEVGLNYSSRSKSHDEFDGQYFLPGGEFSFLQPSSDMVLAPTSLSFAGIPSVMSYNIMGLVSKYYGSPVADVNYNSARIYSTKENVSNFFGKLNIDYNLSGFPLRGNLGLNVIHTDQSSQGIASLLGNPQVSDLNNHVSGGAKYTNVLPSVNLIADLHKLIPETYLRFGLARTMARPRLDDMHAGANVGYTPPGQGSGQGGSFGGDGGNPALRPWVADSWDVSAEKYFGKGSYVALAGFYKNLRSFVYTQSVEKNFTGFPIAPGVTVAPCGPGCNPYIGYISAPANGTGGVVHGVEASVTLQGGLLHSMLDGYGVQGSVSNTLSTIQVPGAGIGGYKASLQGLSGVVSNVTVFYEKYGFSARISERYRSAFRAESLGTHGGLNSIEVMSEGLTDAQLGYEFQSGPMKNLTIQLQGQNLGNTPERTRLVNSAAGGVTGVINSPEQYNLYGRVFLLGAIYKL